MNYIFEVLVKAKNGELDLKEITFKLPEVFSPYLELNEEDLNSTDLNEEIAVNPYYRFFSIFKDLFDPNYSQEEELRRVLMDIIIHFLGQIDLKAGLDQVEYQKKFIHRELSEGAFGPVVEAGIKEFNLSEKNVLLENIRKFYLIENHIHCFKDSVERIFNDSLLYISREIDNEFVLYIEQPKTEENLIKLEVIKELFLPLQFELITYWSYHFGIIGVDKTMEIGNNSIY